MDKTKLFRRPNQKTVAATKCSCRNSSPKWQSMRNVIGCLVLGLWCSGSLAQPLVAAVLPGSRSVEVGTAATAFATIINDGDTLATACGIAPITSVPASFAFQTTDRNTNTPTGSANTPVDIAAGASQSYVFAFTPTAAFPTTDVALSFDCTNTPPAASVVGVNTLALSASDAPVPDIVALAVTPSEDGVAAQPRRSNTAVFSVATVNVGATGAINIDADTGGTSLPVSISICETDPDTSVCINPTTPTTSTVSTTIAEDATPTFGVFVSYNGTVPFDPANSRAFLRASEVGGANRGSTSVAITTVPGVDSFAGNYSGTFTGTDAGSFTAVIDASGDVTGSGFSLEDDAFFTTTGTVDMSGGVVISTGSVSTGATFTGSFTDETSFSGTWTGSGDSGTFTGASLSMGGGTTVFAGAYTGTFDGDDFGRFAVNFDDAGAVTGTAVSDLTGDPVTVSGTVTDSGSLSIVAGTTSDASTFTGQVSAAGNFSGTWSNTVFGEMGTFSGSRF